MNIFDEQAEKIDGIFNIFDEVMDKEDDIGPHQ